MKKIPTLLFSSQMTLLLLMIFAIAIGSATFIEEKFDIVTARLLVYDAWWFELVLLLLALNFIGNISRYKLWRREKISILLFHLAFILLILGAGITRYLGFEGMMHIREGNSSRVIYSSTPYLQVNATGKDFDFSLNKPLLFSEMVPNRFSFGFDTRGKGKISVSFHDYMKNAVSRINENVRGGTTIVQMVLAASEGRETVLIEKGEIVDLGNAVIAYENNNRKDAIRLSERNGKLFLSSPSGIVMSFMHGMGSTSDTTVNPPVTDTIQEFKAGYIYSTQDVLLLFVKRFTGAEKELVRGKANDQGSEVLFVDVAFEGKTRTVPLFVGTGYNTAVKELNLDGVRMKLAYGNKEITLPFSLQLDDFILDRYAGSMSPSSYASEVTLIDSERNLREKRRIYMNHVLDHRGYRFFQSSYDMDEKGTVLSVNHDRAGTWVSYAGYILLAIGFIGTLFNKNSRFRILSKAIDRIRSERKAGIMVTLFFFLFASVSCFAQQETVQPYVGADHAEKFGHLLVQTFDGRFEPIHTLAYDVMHKISRKDQIHTDKKGDMDAIQVFMDMLMDPEYWKHQKIIYVREKAVRDILGVGGQYACFYDFVDQQSNYKLSSFAEKAFRKRPAEQNAFDKEIIKADERINIWMSVQNGSLLKIFPEQNAINHGWISFVDTLARVPLTGKLRDINSDLPLNQLDYNNLMRYYLQAVYDGARTGDYTNADLVLKHLESTQREGTPENLLPTISKINTEIWYNKSQIFITLRNIYGVLSLFLLVFAFAENLRSRKSRFVSWTLNLLTIVLGAAFLYHTWGMALRWYLTGHAPWSNGYEALLLVAWGSLLAGFCFMKYSRITLAATAVLAFMVLMTAGHSSYDPQLTNLQPVLKSYWLIVHVAVITVSYGFLALGFLLGLINMFIFLFKTKIQAFRLDLIIRELTLTNEMTLIIGIVLATIGTFLGGVWANESWGRYWGWDAKETWALVIVITYAIILHLRFVPGLKGNFIFNIASVIGFGSVIMTFVGVNYYLSKGLHSYAADDKKVFPLWGWGLILGIILLMIVAGYRERLSKK
ncbi:MAG: cytochrome c biogenesis protein CcsA [Bacteroidales bacterium]|jgi:cytochrome c-type biogenesis protein CcsB|nr:cytochrome c biogenesis protein CcsA [Bacteroidales bacterium]